MAVYTLLKVAVLLDLSVEPLLVHLDPHVLVCIGIRSIEVGALAPVRLTGSTCWSQTPLTAGATIGPSSGRMGTSVAAVP
jgi:hypothetical protein